MLPDGNIAQQPSLLIATDPSGIGVGCGLVGESGGSREGGWGFLIVSVNECDLASVSSLHVELASVQTNML